MGLCLSKKFVQLNNSKEDLEERIRSLEAKADLNHDGVVSRQEMETYMATQLQLREDNLIKLKQENEGLKTALDKANKRYESLLDKVQKGSTDVTSQTSRVSNVAIEKQIQTWLDDPNTNFSLIPDRAEMYAYKKMLSSLLGGMEKLFETVSIEFMGHRIMITMQPLEEESC